MDKEKIHKVDPKAKVPYINPTISIIKCKWSKALFKCKDGQINKKEQEPILCYLQETNFKVTDKWKVKGWNKVYCANMNQYGVTTK